MLQKAVLSWLKKNAPVKKTKFCCSHIFKYFSAGKTSDAIINNPTLYVEKANKGSELMLEYREPVIDLMTKLIRHDMFHSTKKITVADKKKRKKTDGEASLPSSPQARNRKQKSRETEMELAMERERR